MIDIVHFGSGRLQIQSLVAPYQRRKMLPAASILMVPPKSVISWDSYRGADDQTNKFIVK